MITLTATSGIFICIFMVVSSQKVYNHDLKLPSRRPLIIGHRGTAGTHPEHTILGYQQAIRDGADIIECDVLLTKDLELICMHDPYMSPVTDVAEHPEFADRRRTMTVPDYGEHHDWFCFDFTLAELKTLRVKQRDSFRNPAYDGQYQIPTLDEHIQVAKNAGRPVGIYPEIKVPEIINPLPIMKGKRFEDLFLDALKRHGYTEKDDPCIIQSFNEDSLRYMRPLTNLPMTMLVWKEEHILGPYLNQSKIQEWGKLFYGIGPWKIQVVEHYENSNGFKTNVGKILPLIKEARDAGLRIHLYTFRNEDDFLAWDFQQSAIKEYAFFNTMEIDAYFTDFPGTLNDALNSIYGKHEESTADHHTTCRGSNMSPLFWPNFVLLFMSLILIMPV